MFCYSRDIFLSSQSIVYSTTWTKVDCFVGNGFVTLVLTKGAPSFSALWKSYWLLLIFPWLTQFWTRWIAQTVCTRREMIDWIHYSVYAQRQAVMAHFVIIPDLLLGSQRITVWICACRMTNRFAFVMPLIQLCYHSSCRQRQNSGEMWLLLDLRCSCIDEMRKRRNIPL